MARPDDRRAWPVLAWPMLAGCVLAWPMFTGAMLAWPMLTRSMLAWRVLLPVRRAAFLWKAATTLGGLTFLEALFAATTTATAATAPTAAATAAFIATAFFAWRLLSMLGRL